jgi:hypothetical protein
MNPPFDTQRYLSKRHITVHPESKNAILSPHASRHQRPILLNGKIHPELQETILHMQRSTGSSQHCSVDLQPNASNVCQ